jgi:hypothetical protein
MERVSHCFSIGPQQREGLYPIFERWFRIPRPLPADLAILPDSQLSVSPLREQARQQEEARRRPHADLISIPPVVSAGLNRRPMHRIAWEMGKAQLDAARAAPGGTDRLRSGLKRMLGDIEPGAPSAAIVWQRPLSGAEVEAVSLTVEDGIRVPLLLLHPAKRGAAAVVVAVSQGGKERFLANRGPEIAALLAAGVAVCLPDVRATGETAPTMNRGDGGPYHSIAQMEFDLDRNLLGSRLKDLRTVLAWLRTRTDVDRRRIAIWGDSFTPANPTNLFLDELEYEVGPQVQFRAEPLGAHLALLAALYEDDVRMVAARGGLAGYLTVLEHPFTYVPMEDIILGILKVGDIADIAAALAPRPLLLDGMVNGRNIPIEGPAMERILDPLRSAYRRQNSENRLAIQPEQQQIGLWLVSGLR